MRIPCKTDATPVPEQLGQLGSAWDLHRTEQEHMENLLSQDIDGVGERTVITCGQIKVAKMDAKEIMVMFREMMRKERKEMNEMFMKHMPEQGQSNSTSELASVPNIMSALSNGIEKFVFDPEMDMAFSKWYARYKDIIVEGAMQLTESTRHRKPQKLRDSWALYRAKTSKTDVDLF
ncbi:hypothetical protein ANCDUO_02994 [Ancylostoma duodenale]|uniref:DUF7083 domain-containing protein n=1 Tax=Ancylostoma duodenale TaxID=51022 RepID=A0A0C2H546_9BILA|nr:hypothetical protein ANCDUO_02994 [Ancylostoma duodenale]